MKKINKKLYDVDGLTRAILRTQRELMNAIFRTQRELANNVKSVAELMEPMNQLQTDVVDFQHKCIAVKDRLESLLNGDVAEAKRQNVLYRMKMLAGAGGAVRRQFESLTLVWEKAKIADKKDAEIQERDRRVSNLYGENMKLEERCERAEKHWWWEDWKPKVHDFEGLKEEFVDHVSLLIAMESAGNHVRKWCWHRKIERVGGVNIAALGNDDLIEWVANEYLWKKLPDGMREKICASKDRRAFSLGAFKKKRQRLGTYVNAPTRSKNDRHRESVPMAREVDGA